MNRAKLKPAQIIAPIGIVAAVLLPLIFTNNYHQSLLIQVLINSIVVLGLNFITGLTGQMNLGTAGIFALGAYTSAIICQKVTPSPWLGLLCAIVMGIIIGIGLGYPSLRIRGVYLSLTTIGFSEIVRILLTNLKDLTGGALGIMGIPYFSIPTFNFKTGSFELLQLVSYRQIYYLYLVIFCVLMLIAYRIVNSKWGRAFKSIRDNPDAVEANGINISSLKIMAFTFASIYGCIAGSLYAHYVNFINPAAYNLEFSINYVVMLIIGGISTVGGSIMGAILVTLVPEMLRFLENYYWLIFSIITLLFVIFLPNGIVSLFQKKRRRKGAKDGKNSSKA